jgi:hypothetical protein
MSTCRKVAHQLTELREGELSLVERAGLRFHMTICPSCKRYIKQFDATVDGLAHSKEELPEEESKALVARLMRDRK